MYMTEYEEKSLELLKGIEKHLGFIRRNIEDMDSRNFKHYRQITESVEGMSQIITRYIKK